MSPEMHSEIFPIKPPAIKDAIQWMQAKAPSPDQSQQQLRHIEEENQSFVQFLHDMSSLRHTFQEMETSLSSYHNGALFILNALRKSYEEAQKPFGLPPFERMENYFLHLLDIENNHFEIDSLKERGLSKYEVPDLSSNNKPTSLLFRELKDELMEGSTVLHKRLRETFNQSSQEEQRIMEEGEPEVISATKSPLLAVFGKREDIVLGALDVYELFSAQEEIDKLNAMWDVEIR